MQLLDVTLREGDQMPGRDFGVEEKVDAARALDELGLPFIQPGFPATGEKDRRVFRELEGTTDAALVSLARALESDVDAALETNADVIETFVSASDRHLEHLLGSTREEMLSMLREAVDHIVDHGGTPHVTLADAFRTDADDLIEIVRTIDDVPCVSLADSVGARTPASVQATFDALDGHVEFGRLGVHFHDDLGCATANLLTAYHAGVGRADVSVAGLGERAGNSPLEEAVAACTTDFGDDLSLDVGRLVPVCRDVLETLGESYPPEKAILGERTVEHESGIHTAAMLSDPGTLEPFDPTTFGGERRLLFGTSTGESSARQLLQRAGIEPTAETVDAYVDALATEGPLELDEALSLAVREFGT